MGDIKTIKSLTFPGDDNIYVIASDIGSCDADNIYFTKDLITSYPIGNIELENGIGVIPAKDLSLSEVWENIFVKENTSNLQKIAPSCSISGNSLKYYLVGASSTEQTITLTLNKGSYAYGYGYVADKDESDPVSGTVAVTRVTTDGTGVIPDTSEPYSLTWDGVKVSPTSTNGNTFKCTGIKKIDAPAQAQIVGTINYINAGNPVSNLGKIYPEDAYPNGSTNANKQTLARWYYPIYQGFTYEGNTDVGAVIADPESINGTQLKTKLSTPSSGSTNTNAVIIDEDAYEKIKLTKAVASKPWRQYFLAYPSDYGFEMQAAKDGQNITCSVHKKEAPIELIFNGVRVEYTVYYIHNAAPYNNTEISWNLNEGGK